MRYASECSGRFSRPLSFLGGLFSSGASYFCAERQESENLGLRSYVKFNILSTPRYLSGRSMVGWPGKETRISGSWRSGMRRADWENGVDFLGPAK